MSRISEMAARRNVSMKSLWEIVREESPLSYSEFIFYCSDSKGSSAGPKVTQVRESALGILGKIPETQKVSFAKRCKAAGTSMKGLYNKYRERYPEEEINYETWRQAFYRTYQPWQTTIVGHAETILKELETT